MASIEDFKDWSVSVTKVYKVEYLSDNVLSSIDLSLTWELVKVLCVQIVPQDGGIYYEGNLRPQGNRSNLRLLFPKTL